MLWRLRRASADDAAAVALVAAASFLETFAGVIAGPDMIAHCSRNSSVKKFAGWATSSDSVVTLAEHPDGAAPVGYSLLTSPDLPVAVGADDIELRRIYTLSLAQGTGLGTALMTQAIADARTLGKSRMLLGVLDRNRRACAFYERQGFVVAGRRNFLVGQTWFDDLVYARDL